MKEGTEPEVGQKLWLRKIKPEEKVEPKKEETELIEFDTEE
jgi:hypothetical protein